MDKRNASAEQLTESRQGRASENAHNVELVRSQLTKRLEHSVEESTAIEVVCFSGKTLLLSAANRLGVKVDYNFKFANENNRTGDEHRRRKLAGKADYLTLFDQCVRLHRTFVKIRNSGMREAAINSMVFLAEVGDMR